MRTDDTNKIFIEALFDVVAISEASGKLYRRLPETVVNAIEKDSVKCPVSV